MGLGYILSTSSTPPSPSLSLELHLHSTPHHTTHMVMVIGLFFCGLFLFRAVRFLFLYIYNLKKTITWTNLRLQPLNMSSPKNPCHVHSRPKECCSPAMRSLLQCLALVEPQFRHGIYIRTNHASPLASRVDQIQAKRPVFKLEPIHFSDKGILLFFLNIIL